MMNLEQIDAYFLQHEGEIQSEHYGDFVRKAKLHLDADVVHIAGSNGKSEVAFYLTLLLKSRLGEKVGTLYNAYFHHFNEAICLGGKPLDLSEAVDEFNALYPLAEKYQITSFEYLVAIAYRVFNKRGVDVAVIETGLGGSYDPTNLPNLNTIGAIITNVSLEHTEYLGTTVGEIALNFSGIINHGHPVYLGSMDSETYDAMRAICGKYECPVLRLERVYLPHLVNGKEFHFDYPPFKDIVVQGFASYHVGNACIAIEMAKNLAVTKDMSEEEVRAALCLGELPGHLERNGDVVFDPASNPDATSALVRCFNTVGKGKHVHVLFAAREDENISVMLPLLADAAFDVTLTTFDYPSARQEMGFALYTVDHEYIENPLMALMSLQMKYPGETVVLTGCHEFVRYMKAYLENA